MSAPAAANNGPNPVIRSPFPSMDNALATTTSNALVPGGAPPALPTLGSRWQTLPGRTQAAALLGLVALAAVVVAMAFGARDSDYRPLFSGISEKDGGAIIDRLSQMNVPYRVSEGGSTILVPAARAAELKLKLAAAGLPSTMAGASAGYELLDKSPFGQTQGQELMKFKRVTEGELTNTIVALEGVKSVRVHLALPQQNGFFREQQKPSAAVNLTLYPGRTLDRAQIAGIVGLVTGSVPEMAAKAVRLSDGTGAQLWPSGDDEQGLDTQQLQYRREVESGYLRRVAELLEPVVGRDNVRATVTADIDFSQVLQTAEAYRPNQGSDAKPAVREQRTEESTQPGSATPSGVPGAASNLPQATPTAPINGPAQVLQAAQGGSTGSGNMRREAAMRFEVDKTTTVTRNAVGAVRRLSAAVVVNHRSGTDAKGKPTSTPLSDKEIEQLTALVQQGIGFNSERGDLVKVINVPFRVEKPAAVEEVPAWKQPWLVDLLKSTAGPAALALVALVIVFTLVRPALKTLLAPPAASEPALGAQLNEVVDGAVSAEQDAQKLLLAQTQLQRLENARAMARSNPAAVAHIVRGWVSGETA